MSTRAGGIVACLVCFLAIALTGVSARAADYDTLRVGVAVDAKNMDPQNSVDTFSFSMQRQIYEPLFTVDGKTKKLVPVLVESWEQPDPETWVFHLKKGVRFHNGEELTAEDVEFSFRRVASPESVFAASKGVKFDFDRFEIVDKYTIVVRTKGPVGGFLESMKHPYASILSKKAVTEAGKEYFRHPVGTGPYRFVEWVKGGHLDLEAFEDYHGQKPNFKKMSFVVLPDDSSRVIALETGAVDMIYAVPYSDFDRLSGSDRVQMVQVPGLVLLHMGINTRKEQLKDPKVRMAIEYAVDQQAYCQVVYGGKAVVPQGPLPPASGFYPEHPEGYGYDPEKAKALLKEAGYPDGMDLSIYVINAQDRIDGATVLQAMLAQVGIRLKIEVFENAVFDDKLNTGEHDLYIGTWGMQTTRDAGEHWEGLFLISAIGSTNKTGTNDAELDGNLRKVMATVDSAERDVLFRKIWDRINELHPCVYLAIANELIGGRKDLVGLEDLCDGKINYLGNLSYRR